MSKSVGKKLCVKRLGWDNARKSANTTENKPFKTFSCEWTSLGLSKMHDFIYLYKMELLEKKSFDKI